MITPTGDELQTQEYWDRRYEAEKPDEDFDWFKSYADIRDVIHELIPNRSSRVLMLGCGNSTLSADMYADGYTGITNLDYSSILISKMRARHPHMDWKTMDVRELVQNDAQLGGPGSWDVVIDKGTMDALMSEKGSPWDPSETVRTNVRQEIDGVLHLLTPHSGTFIYLTFGQPHFRLPHLERPGPGGWSIETRTLGDMFHYFLYVCRMR